MTDFINRQTTWYNGKKNEIDSVRMKAMEFTETGRQRKGRIMQDALNRAEMAIYVSAAVRDIFGVKVDPNSIKKAIDQINESRKLVDKIYTQPIFKNGGWTTEYKNFTHESELLNSINKINKHE